MEGLYLVDLLAKSFKITSKHKARTLAHVHHFYQKRIQKYLKINLKGTSSYGCQLPVSRFLG